LIGQEPGQKGLVLGIIGRDPQGNLKVGQSFLRFPPPSQENPEVAMGLNQPGVEFDSLAKGDFGLLVVFGNEEKPA